MTSPILAPGGPDSTPAIPEGTHSDGMRALAERLRVCLVSGSLPPELCGVGDYTARLGAALAELGVAVELVEQRGGDRIGSVLARLPQDAIVHLQYPTVGAGHSLAPLAGVLRRRRVVLTLHEFSHVHPLRRAFGAGLANAAGQVVVSTEHERQRLARWLVPGRTPRITVLPIPPNIPVGRGAQPRTWAQALRQSRNGGKPFTLGYFGIIRSDDAMVRFLQLAERLVQRADAAGDDVRVVVIGGWHDEDRMFVQAQQARTSGWPLTWTGRLGDDAVTEALAALDAAYLPFRDGISDRRTSAAAMLANGVPLLTTAGPATTAALRHAVAIVDDPDHALQTVQQLDAGTIAAMAERGRAQVANRSVTRLAEQHVVLYQAVWRGDGRRPHVVAPG